MSVLYSAAWFHVIFEKISSIIYSRNQIELEQVHDLGALEEFICQFKHDVSVICIYGDGCTMYM